MSKPRRDSQYLADILEAVQRILAYTRGLSFEAFMQHRDELARFSPTDRSYSAGRSRQGSLMLKRQKMLDHPLGVSVPGSAVGAQQRDCKHGVDHKGQPN